MAVDDSTQNQIDGEQRSFLRRLTRAGAKLLGFVLSLLLILGIVAALMGAGWFGMRELRRSFMAVDDRIDQANAQIGDLQQTISDLDADLAAQGDTLAAAEEAIEETDTRLEEAVGEAADQQAQIVGLEDQAVEQGGLITENSERLAILGSGLTAVQSDANEMSVRLDELGGQLDSLDPELDALAAQIETMESVLDMMGQEVIAARQVFPTEGAYNAGQLDQLLGLLFISNQIVRARLQLILGSAETAASTVGTAVQFVDNFSAEHENLLPAGLDTVQEHLQMVAEALPEDVQPAVINLEAAWNSLNQLTSEQLAAFSVDGEVELSGETEDGEAVTATPLPEMTPTSEQSPTPAPTETAVPTATPTP